MSCALFWCAGIHADQRKGSAVGAALPQDTLTIATDPVGLAEAGHRSDMGMEPFAPDRGGEANISLAEDSFGLACWMRY